MKIDGVNFDLGSKISGLDQPEGSGAISFGAGQDVSGTDASNIDVDLEQMIKDGIAAVDAPQKQLNEKIGNFLQGKEQLHNVMIASEEAKFSMNFTVKVRDRIIDAYQTIMRMQV
jgi:flagellar hook-basal body complex protein FliE